jgi:hypothetical protein
LPAVSQDALTAMGQQVRQWRLHMWVRRDLVELATMINPVVVGWMNYCVSRGHARLDRRAVGSMV